MNGYGAPQTFGVNTATWTSWASGYDGSLGQYSPRQQLWLQNYNRTKAQEEYHETSGGWDTAAYVYTGYVDLLLGTDAAVVGEKVNDELIPKVKETVEASYTPIILAVLAASWIASR